MRVSVNGGDRGLIIELIKPGAGGWKQPRANAGPPSIHPPSRLPCSPAIVITSMLLLLLPTVQLLTVWTTSGPYFRFWQIHTDIL